MIKHSLLIFADKAVESGSLSAKDVGELQRLVLPDGITCREEADTLIALDRAVPGADPAFAEFLVAELVDFAVWTSRPTGYVDQDTARWLVASLGCGSGPTENARRIAFEVVKEAEQVDEALLAFAMRGAKQRSGAAARPASRELAA